MQLVEQHIVKHDKNNALWQEVDRVCFYAKNIYNAALYKIRQHYFETGEYLNYYAVEKLFKKKDLLPDQCLPMSVVQQTLMLVDKSFKSFFKAVKAYQRNPSKFTGRPKLPAYKAKSMGRNVAVYTINGVSKRQLRNGIIKLSDTDVRIKTCVPTDTINQVRIVPKGSHYVIEVIYSVEPEYCDDIDKDKILSIDLGVDNIAILTSNQPEFRPVLVNGRVIKSINQWYNKVLAHLKSQLQFGQRTSKRINRLTFKRNQRIQNQLHHVSRYIIDLMLENGIGTLVVGKNDGWKQSIKIGKCNNQTFVQIPHSRLIDMLRYKAELVGIDVIVVEESYTSKCSFLDREEVGRHEVYAGRRVTRSKFVSSTGQVIHADVNGSLNVMRKVFPNIISDDLVKGIEVFGGMPVQVNVL